MLNFRANGGKGRGLWHLDYYIFEFCCLKIFSCSTAFAAQAQKTFIMCKGYKRFCKHCKKNFSKVVVLTGIFVIITGFAKVSTMMRILLGCVFLAKKKYNIEQMENTTRLLTTLKVCESKHNHHTTMPERQVSQCEPMEKTTRLLATLKVCESRHNHHTTMPE